MAIIPMEGFTFGCDPELFVLNENGLAVSAAGLIPGTKEAPHPVEFGAVQVDGMAAEFNIDPVSTFEDWDRNIREVMKQLKAMLPKGYSLECSPSMTFSQEVWDASPPEAKALGCTPDFNAWTGEVNPPPSDPKNPTLRTASGHVHIGWTSDASMSDNVHLGNCRDLVKQLDWYCGGWSARVDPDNVRKRLYGKAGAMRYKDYGVEYRVMSNFWLKTATSRQNVWNRMNKAIHDMATVYVPDKANMSKYQFNDRLIQSINTGEMDKLLLERYAFPIISVMK
jgi:hypothetical protein